MLLNNIKNKLKIFIRNFRNYKNLFMKGEIPRINILKNKNVINAKQYPKIKNTNKNFIISSNNQKVLNSRFDEFSQMFSKFEQFNIFYFSHKERDSYMKSFWGNSEIFNIYQNSIFQQSKADIFRYCFLFDNGGFWLDFKSTIKVNPNNLLDDKHSIVLLSSTRVLEENKFKDLDPEIKNLLKSRYITNWFIGSEKGNKFIELIIHNICKSKDKYKNIVFEDPKQPDMLPITNIKERNDLTFQRVGYEAEERKLVIFRSYLRHMVEPCKNKSPRMSIAVNFN